jgi:hypothetical protein
MPKRISRIADNAFCGIQAEMSLATEVTATKVTKPAFAGWDEAG